MKKTAAIILALVSNFALATGQQCVAWDYARLKDSTAEDLIAHACEAKKSARINQDEKFELLSHVGAQLDRVDQLGAAEALCKDQEKVTKSVFQQKFGKSMPDCAAQAQVAK